MILSGFLLIEILVFDLPGLPLIAFECVVVLPPSVMVFHHQQISYQHNLTAATATSLPFQELIVCSKNKTHMDQIYL